MGALNTRNDAAARAANPAKNANDPHNQRDDSAKELLKPAKIGSQALVDRIRTLRADKSAEYRFSGIQHPVPLQSGQRPLEQLAEILERDGIRFSVEGGLLTRWSNSSVSVALIDEISAYEEQIAGAIGAHSVCRCHDDSCVGETDSRCSCGRMATYAVYDAHQPDNERWLCEGCFDEGAPYPPAPLRRKTAYQQHSPTTAPQKPPQSIERPDEMQRMNWWCEPVHGWGSGWFVIHNMAADQTVKIDIRKDENND